MLLMENLEIAEEYDNSKQYFKAKGLELIAANDSIEGKIYLVRKKEK